MSVRSSVKHLVQRSVLSGPVYARMRSAALRRPGAHVPGARERIARIEPCPERMLAEATPMPEPTLDISVIVPVYNVERYVSECLESILSQNIGNGTFEVVAVDDGSTDSSGAIVDQFSERDGRLRVIHQENGGLSSARNTGLDAARGRFVAFVDSDDRLAPGHLHALLEAMELGTTDVVSGLWRRIDEDGAPLGLGEARRTHMAPWGRLYRRSVWERVRFPLGCWYEDLLTPCLIQPLHTEVFVNDAGYLYRERAGSIVASSPTSPKALDTYWVLDGLLHARADWGVRLDVNDLNRLLPVFGPTLMGRVTILGVDDLRALFSLLCDLFASLDELANIHTTRVGAWRDLELALRERKFELWCLACAAVAAESRDVKIMTALSYFRAAMGQR